MKVSIRSKLTILILGVCLGIILVMWVSTVVLFKPMYYAMTQAQVTRTMNRIRDIIDENGGSITSTVYDEIKNASVSNMCIEISDSVGGNIWLSEGIGDSCQIHFRVGGALPGSHIMNKTIDTPTSVAIRNAIRESGEYFDTIVDDMDNRQIVMGRLIDDRYAVIVSTNLVQADAAIGIVLSQLQSATLIAIVLALIISAIMSDWFIRPVLTLSKATKEVSKGNYRTNIAVSADFNDELGQLASDFNGMVREIENSQQMQRELVASISHDLRTPLTIIKGYAESIRDMTGNDPEIRTRQLNTIIDETDRLTKMVNSVMEYSKLNRDNYKLNIVQYNIRDMCNDVVDIYTDKAAKEGKTIVYEGPEEVYVMADATLIERVLHNFVSNALLHTPEGTQVRVKVRVQDDGKVKVSVADSGSGISEEDQKHIFERYYRSRKNSGKQGTGLGLAIVKAILENHGFPYGVDSRLGEGSEFWFIM